MAQALHLQHQHPQETRETVSASALDGSGEKNPQTQRYLGTSCYKVNDAPSARRYFTLIARNHPQIQTTLCHGHCRPSWLGRGRINISALQSKKRSIMPHQCLGNRMRLRQQNLGVNRDIPACTQMKGQESPSLCKFNMLHSSYCVVYYRYVAHLDSKAN